MGDEHNIFIVEGAENMSAPALAQHPESCIVRRAQRLYRDTSGCDEF
jgi:hypothetical protein